VTGLLFSRSAFLCHRLAILLEHQTMLRHREVPSGCAVILWIWAHSRLLSRIIGRVRMSSRLALLGQNDDCYRRNIPLALRDPVGIPTARQNVLE
jgi:hypothetical protein